MLKKIIIPAISITGVALLSGCATQATSYPSFSASPVGQDSSTVAFKQKTNTMFVVLDASSSTAEVFDGNSSGDTKFNVEKQILHNINKSIPQGIKLSSGLRTFGFSFDSCSNNLEQEVSSYSPSAFQASLDNAQCAIGGSPMENALSDAATDLENAPGNIALLVVSDGHQISSRALTAAQELEDKFGDRLCVYSVWVGNEDEQAGRNFLQGLSGIAGCGTGVSATELNSSPAVASFVESILFDKSALTPRPRPIARVDVDTDGDGVIDRKDQCPNTPKGAHVNSVGCWSFNNVEFAFNKAEIQPQYAPLFDNAVQVLQNNPSMTVLLEGHTDSRGTAIYNQGLSERRALAVKNLLVNKGIKSNRLTTKSFGESRPIATNDTEAGRAENRRVDFTVTRR
ncbi:MAG: OmpA family protein [Methylococcaceae bacterium]|nr:OmpA family protein [Methylococcaceae bacterium]